MGPVNLENTIACAILLAALVVRTAMAEIKEKGAARKQWSFLANGTAVAVGAAFFLAAVALIIITGVGWGSAVWALLIGLLAALIADQLAGR